MDNGFIVLHRKIMKWYGYTDSQRLSLWVHLLMMASHKDSKFIFNGSPVLVKRGQLITGRKKLSSDTGIPETSIERFLNEFEKDEMLGQQKTYRNRLITITNYEQYQSLDSRRTADGQLTDSWRTADGHIQQCNNDNNETIYTPLFEKIWNKYPKRVGKKNALRHFKSSVKTEEDFKKIESALKNYLSSKRVSEGFIQNGSTWFNDWESWCDFTEQVCTKCKGRGKFTSATGYEIICDCPAGGRVK